MKYFLDTEFIEDGKTIDLMSVGIVCEDGRTLYRQNCDCNFRMASDWVWRNVLIHLLDFNMCGQRLCSEKSYCTGETHTGRCHKEDCTWAHRSQIRDEVKEFCNPEKHGKPEFWGYFADYDWVVFCQLFGTMMDLPKGFPMYCRDIKQWVDQKDGACIPKPEKEIHHALSDAEWVKEAYDFLAALKEPYISPI